MSVPAFTWAWSSYLVFILWIAGGPGAVQGGEILDRSLPDAGSRASSDALKRARVYLEAGDFRRAIEACQEEVDARPSAASYVYLTYVYHAVNGYMEYQASQDRWVLIEQLVRNLSGDRPDVLIDPPDILPRIAKEIIGVSVQRESDVTAAMATRLNRTTTETLWKQQTDWRAAHPENWWYGIPEEWRW
ncbi:hypothetical protein YTPLAS18_14170 [Nitrospira sp.]|nr:hypothetical protein YTPLAS18_14170 [Nitrospira sp.]